MYRSTLLWIMCLALTAWAWADTAPECIQFNSSETVLLPSGEFRDRSTLDDAQPDTILYDGGSVQSFWSTVNLWSKIRFTAPDDFELRSVYFVANNPNSYTNVCSLYVYTSSAGQLGTQLARWALTGTVTHLNSFTNPTWNDVNLPTPVQIDSAQDFFVIVGPAPGGAQTAGWHIISDGTPTGDRSTKSSNGHNGTYSSANGDWLVRVGGQAEAFVDLTAEECYNNTANGATFNVLTGTPITFKASIKNIGNTTVSDYTVRWIVRNPSGTTVYSNEVVGTTLARNLTAQLSDADTFTPSVDGVHMVAAIVNATNDAVAGNDTSWLRLFVGPQPRWFRYDDNADPDGYTSFTAGNGWGLSFKPVTYSAAIESLRIAGNVGTPAAGNVQIWLNDAAGAPDTVIWSGTPTLALGWNKFAVTPPQIIYLGQSFTVAFIYTSVSLGQDQNPPNAGDMPHMGTQAWQYESSTWSADESGNWCMQVFMDTSSLLPPYPVIETDPVDSLLFGQVDTTGSTSSVINLVIYNRGSGDSLDVSGIQILPGTIRSAFTILPGTIKVGAGDSGIVAITFNPGSVRTYIGTVTVSNNSTNMPTLTLVLRAEGVRPFAVDNPESSLPRAFALEQNFPNPFNPSTDIRFALPVAADVHLTVFNILGQEIAVLAEGPHTAGLHTVTFDASRLPAGVYFYRLEAGSFSDIRKMLLLK
jgi:hypothetical protein